MAVNREGPAGTLAWAVRESLVRYVTVVGRGGYTVNDGATECEGGQFVFTLRRAVREDDDWRLSFAGALRFTAHHGVLDILIKDPELVIGPQGGVLATHISGDPDELIAVATLGPASPVESGGQLVWSEVSTHLVSAGVGLFGNVYPIGTDMAPLKISVLPNL